MPVSTTTPSILLPSLPGSAPLPEVVLFAFDALAFPFQHHVRTQLLTGQHPRLVLRHGEEGAHDEALRYGGTVVRIGDTFHLWYQGNYGPQLNEITYERTNFCLCYAYSVDGVTWEKPELGLVEFNGSRQNNIIDLPAQMPRPGCAVLHDPAETSGLRRFKMIYMDGGRQACAAFSADGLRWRPSPQNPLGPSLEVGGVVRYRDLYYLYGQEVGHTARRLVVYVSADFEHWSPCAAPGLERAPEALEEVHHGAGCWQRGNVILGIYGQWHGHPSGDRRFVSIDLGLALSHDGVRFYEPVPGFPLVAAREQPFSPAGVSPALLHGQGMENHGEQTLYWYALWRGAKGSGVRLVTWPRDRMGLLQPTQPWDAQVISTPFEIIRGRARVRVNVSGLSEHSRLRVSLVDGGFRPLPGYSGDGAALLTEDGFRLPVRWGGGDQLAPAHGMVRLDIRFEGVRPEDCCLHAVYIAE